LRDEIENRGCDALVIDVAVVGEPAFEPDVPRERGRRGGRRRPRQAGRAAGDRGEAVGAMARGIAAGRSAAVRRGPHPRRDLGWAGAPARCIGSSAMRALPVGVPKVLVSTVASGDVAAYVGMSDITMMHSVVDVSGVNSISRKIYGNAAGAIAGMVRSDVAAGDDKPIIAATMFGNTTRAVNQAKAPRGAGVRGAGVPRHRRGRTLHGSPGRRRSHRRGARHDHDRVGRRAVRRRAERRPQRLEAAAAPAFRRSWCRAASTCATSGRATRCPSGTGPHLLPVEPQHHPDADDGRRRTRRLGEIFAEKLNAATGPVEVYVPMGGFSEIDVDGQAVPPARGERGVRGRAARNGSGPASRSRGSTPTSTIPPSPRAAVETLVEMLQQKGRT
jgi:hypothetical protein